MQHQVVSPGEANSHVYKTAEATTAEGAILAVFGLNRIRVYELSVIFGKPDLSRGR
jgi:hypothetical protein